MESVFARVFSLTPKAAREELRGTFGAQLERWTAAAGVRVCDLADAIGHDRPHVYKFFTGDRVFRAEMLWLLPPAVLKPILEDLAASIGYELRPQGERNPAAVASVLAESGDVLRTIGAALADGVIDASEAAAIRTELSEMREAAASLDLDLREIIASRGNVTAIKGGRAS